jgi:preprotein translocase subunit Sec63
MLYFILFYFFFNYLTYRLTDEETKKNWEEYGNPDGPGG